MAPQVHQFNAIAFEENFNLRQIATHFPEARVTLRELRYTIQGGGAIDIFPFGAMVSYDVPADQREVELQRLRTAMPKLTTRVVREDYTVAEDPVFKTGIEGDILEDCPRHRPHLAPQRPTLRRQGDRHRFVRRRVAAASGR